MVRGPRVGRLEPTPAAVRVTLGKLLGHDGHRGTASCPCSDSPGWGFWGLLKLPPHLPTSCPPDKEPPEQRTSELRGPQGEVILT